ncbi:MAG: hypothetical protein GF313_10850, partial [Caldithrix sp.]|nr:hypothetical protein [Caldithrix sp.]
MNKIFNHLVAPLVAALLVSYISLTYSSEVNKGESGKITIRALKNEPGEVRLSINFTEPTWIEHKNDLTAEYDDSRLAMGKDGALIPYVSKIISLSGNGNPGHQIVNVEWNHQTLDKPIRFLNNNSLQRVDATNWVQIHSLGMYRGMQLVAVNIFPVQTEASTQKIKWMEHCTVDIISEHSDQKNNPIKNQAINEKLLKTLSVNHPVAQINPQLNNLHSTQSLPRNSFSNRLANARHIFKIIVDEEGIYKITYQDLKDAGFAVDEINPKKLHLFNKGKEISIYFKGQGDGVFNVADYLEFWGESNKKTFFDKNKFMYSDPFSDSNVYWLFVTEVSGLRMGEESVGLKNLQYIFEPYAFRETIHFEENNYFARLGHISSNVNRPAFESDHWFYDAGIQAPEGGAYDFFLPHPYESGGNVQVKVALHGRSFFEYPINPLEGHEVTVKLRGSNNIAKLIGRVDANRKWNDQTPFMVTNQDSIRKIDQSLLQHGTNRLEIDMFQEGVSDIVLLNWFEINYLRKYFALNDFLKFRVDKTFFDGQYIQLGDAIQFSVNGFDSQNIDIYKLGVSKLNNAQIKKISDVEEFESYYRLTFQDEVFDTDIEYVAVSQKAKKSPSAIQPYRPWNPEFTDASLLNKENSANYIIITTDLL